MHSRLILILLISGSGLTSWMSSRESTKSAALIPSPSSNFPARISSAESFYPPDLTEPIEGEFVSGQMLPDLQTLPPTKLQLFHEADSGRTYLRFSNSIWNSGPGVLELIGTPNHSGDQIQVIQRIYGSDPEMFEQHQVGVFVFHERHNHWHLEQFASYEIWSVDEGGALERMVATGGKVSYCVMDVSLAENEYPEGIVPRYKSYTHCEDNLQGLSVGWADTYKYFFPGQSIEVSSLEDGIYALVSTVDPLHLIKEGNNHNNSARVYFELNKRQLKIVDYLFTGEEDGPNPK